MKIDEYWPDWRDEIGVNRRLTEHITSRRATPQTEEMDQILANQNTILKGLFWLLTEATGSVGSDGSD